MYKTGGFRMKDYRSLYNIRETKSNYSTIQKQALNGLPILTRNNNEKTSVIHINEEILDVLLNILKIYLEKEFDEGMGIYTALIEKINLYGEGKTVNEAIEDLIDSIVEWCDIYHENIDRYKKLFDDEYRTYMLKFLLISDDRNEIRKQLVI